MADVEDIIEYLSTLRRGYDKVEFSERLKDLGGLIESEPLAPDDFNKLFKIWLKLEIPISKWNVLGTCLVPIHQLDSETVSFAARWLLSGLHREVSSSRLGFLLNWLTAALENNLVSAQDLDKYYEVFHTLFQYDRYANNAAKLLYTLTKPTDVTRCVTQFLLNLQLKRQTSRDKAQITALLSLYKSYRPECVPESIPAVSLHNAFAKINPILLRRFARVRDYLNAVDTSCHLKWRTHLSERGLLGRGHKVRRLVPDMEFINIGSELYSETCSKNFLHFKDGVKLLTYSLQERAPRPAQLLSLLCNETGLVLLAGMDGDQHTFLSHDLHHLLRACFIFPNNRHPYSEKADLLSRVARLQECLQQPVPVVSSFLAEYLPTWNACDYFEQILSLLCWIHPDSVEDLRCRIFRPLLPIYRTLPALTRLDVLRSLTSLYNNMAFSRTRTRQLFLKAAPRTDHLAMMQEIAEFVQELCLQDLNTYPDSWIVLNNALTAHAELNASELARAPPRLTLLPPRAAAAALVSQALPALAHLILLERKIFTRLLKRDEIDTEEPAKILTGYKNDILNNLIKGCGLSQRQDGLIFNHIPEKTVQLLLETFPDVEHTMTIGRHVSMAPYTYTKLENIDLKKVKNENWLEYVIKDQFKDVWVLLSKIGRKTEA